MKGLSEKAAPMLPSSAPQNGDDRHEGSKNQSLSAAASVVNLDRSPRSRVQTVAQRYGVMMPAPLAELLALKFGNDAIEAMTTVGNAGQLPQYVETGMIEIVARNHVQQRLMRA